MKWVAAVTFPFTHASFTMHVRMHASLIFFKIDYTNVSFCYEVIEQFHVSKRCGVCPLRVHSQEKSERCCAPLPPPTLAARKQHFLSLRWTSEMDSGYSNQCGICANGLIEPVGVSGCEHRFCRACFAHWENTGSRGCPDCQAKSKQ